MKQYYGIKAVHGDAILLFRVGDFYETFGEDAIKASKILGITLTRRANGAASYVELAGFPYHAVDTYLPKLVRAGERVAVLGRNGSGKSTLLQLLAGMQEPQQGSILLDDIALNHLDPADVRRDMQLLSQQARLFFGSVRDNILMGNPLATDDEIHQALVNSGALEFVRKQKMGLNTIINEGGTGLSGGQRQALLLARALIVSPNILLLDEPTAWLDEMSEKQFIQHLHKWLGKRRTLVVATHRLPILDLVDRIIVLENGKVVMDGPRDAILHQHGMAPQKAVQRTVTMKTEGVA